MRIFGEEERVESGNSGASTNRPTRVKLLILILALLIVIPIALSVLFYYLPLNDVEATVYHTSPETEGDWSYILLKVNVTNKGIISHYVYLYATVEFSTEPGMIYTKTHSSLGPINAGSTYPIVRVRVPVPSELLQDPYEASCSVTLPPLVNQYSSAFIVFTTVFWLIGVAAVSTSIVRSWRKER